MQNGEFQISTLCYILVLSNQGQWHRQSMWHV